MPLASPQPDPHLRPEDVPPMASAPHVQIGDVAERTGLSLRTIRWYEEVGLVTPSSRTRGGFRLYSAHDVARLELIKQMKPLDVTLEEMGDLLGLLERLQDPALDDDERRVLHARLAGYRSLVEQRLEALRSKLANAEGLAHLLDRAAVASAAVRGRRSGMPTVFLVPRGTDSADAASAGDYLLRPTDGDEYEVGKVDRACTWLGTVARSLLPSLPDVDRPQEAPEQEQVLAAVQGVESAQAHRGA